MQVFKVSKKMMGSAFELGLVSNNKEAANKLLEIGIQEIERLENLLSEFITSSDVSKINQSHHKEFISAECFDLIVRAQNISKLSQGDFDITTKPLKSLYNFKNTDFEFPDKREIKKALKNVGYQKLKLNPQEKSVTCTQSIQISFAAIGKGYASDKVKQLWQEHGVTSGYINASGDLNAFGVRPNHEPWKVTIVNPNNANQKIFRIPIQNTAVATSGNYYQYFMYKGEKYSHNINPKTGIPLKEIKSATVFSPSAELSDALATAVTVKGVKNGLEFINSLPNTHCVLIDQQDKIHFSNEINFHQNEI